MVLLLPPDVTYCLDAAAETGDITGDVRMFFNVFDDGAVAWFDDIDRTMSEMSFADAATERMQAWRAKADPLDAAGLTWSGLVALPWRIDEHSRGVASHALRRRQLGEPVDIIDQCRGEMALLTRGWPRLIDRAQEDIARLGRETFLAARARIDDLIRATARRRNAELERLRARIRTGEEVWVDRAMADRNYVAPKARREKRKPLVRAARLLEKVIGSREASGWIKGDTFVVEGRRFDFRTRLANIYATGHGAMDLTVTDKEGVLLCDLCFYFRDTPALDQLAALVFHVQAGEEDEIIRTANVIRVHDRAASSPVFRDLRDGSVAEREEERTQAAALRITGSDAEMLVPQSEDADQTWRDLRDEAHDVLICEFMDRAPFGSFMASIGLHLEPRRAPALAFTG